MCSLTRLVLPQVVIRKKAPTAKEAKSSSAVNQAIRAGAVSLAMASADLSFPLWFLAFDCLCLFRFSSRAWISLRPSLHTSEGWHSGAGDFSGQLALLGRGQ